MMKQIVMFSPDGGMGSAFKMAGDLDGGETPKENDCPNCGAELVSGAAFCGECGKTAEKETGSGEKVENMPEPAVHKTPDVSSFFTSGGNLDGSEMVKPVKRNVTAGPSVRTSETRKTTTGPKAKTTGKKPVLIADIKTKKVKNNSGVGMKELIRDIHMEIREGSLVALLGTAGAGKSTVMNCLNGMDLQGVEGRVLYRGVDLMKHFEEMKYLIGSVPQKKIFHAAFTPEEEFTQAAMLRLPADTSDAEIKRRVDRTLEMLSMTGVRKNRNSKLSGGEQTRVNVGIELVADRDLLCLDEPDQGLSPNYKHELFEIMQNLAHTYGKTVLSIIHDVSEIDMFDQVVMLAKVDGVGRLAFSGTPAEAREYFGVDIRDAYALLERDPKRFLK